MPFDFQHKTVLITGAAGGIGEATALAFARAGARLVLADRDADGVARVQQAVQALGAEALAVSADVTRAADAARMVQAAVDAWGRLDCAFNNAGIEEEHLRLHECSEDTFDRIMGVNVKGVWLCMQQQLARMLAQGGGSIVNTASVAGLLGAPKMAAYSASKHAVLGLTRSAAVEYARKGIRVNAVCPAVIRTAMYERAVAADPKIGPAVAQMHPVGRLGEAAEVAAAVLWLSSDAASFVTGLAHTVDGGMTAI